MKNGYKLYQCQFDNSGCFIPILGARIDFDYSSEATRFLSDKGEVFDIEYDNPMYSSFLVPAGKVVEIYAVKTGIAYKYWIVVED